MKSPSKYVSTVFFSVTATTRMKAKFQRRIWNPTYSINLNSWESFIMCKQWEPIMAFTVMWQRWLKKTQIVNWTYLLWNNQENVSMTFGNYFHTNVFRLIINVKVSQNNVVYIWHLDLWFGNIWLFPFLAELFSFWKYKMEVTKLIFVTF